MKSKVTIEEGRNYHYHYMVHVYDEDYEDDDKWIPVQSFDPNEREEAINYAKDIARAQLIGEFGEFREFDIWMSE